MVFSKKWLKNPPQFLLHFLIQIDVLMLYSKFELILTNNFQVMNVFKMSQFLKKSKGSSPWLYQKLALKLPPIYITFSDTY